MEPAKKSTPDAQDRMTRLRTKASELPHEADPKALATAVRDEARAPRRRRQSRSRDYEVLHALGFFSVDSTSV